MTIDLQSVSAVKAAQEATARSSQNKTEADIQTRENSSVKQDELASFERVPDKKEELTEVSRKRIEEAVTKLKDYAENHKREIRFSIDDDTGRTIVKLMDNENKVLRQIPSEELLNLVKSIEQNKGLFLEDEA